MVVGGRLTEERSGRRSRGPSPNNRVSEDSSDSDESDSDGGMRVGKDYQAEIPPHNPDVKPEARAEAMLVWAPHPDIPSSKVDEYITVAKERHGYNMEQSLGMLFWHKHHIEKALTDLANFTPFPDEWTVEDKVLFEQAFSFHGKSFHRIRQMNEDDKNGSIRPGPASKKLELHPRNKKHKKKPPRGMYLTQDDLLALATGPPGQGEALLKQLDAELVQLKRNVQNNKQLVSMHKQKAHGGIDSHRLPSVSQKIIPKWTNEELLLAVQGIRKYGKDFKAVAEVLDNKTESHIRNFFVNYRRRYNLDEVLSHFEKENGIPPEKRRKTENGEETVNKDEGILAKLPAEETGSDENIVPSGGDLNSKDCEKTDVTGATFIKPPTSPSRQQPLQLNGNKGSQAMKVNSTSPIPNQKLDIKVPNKTETTAH